MVSVEAIALSLSIHVIGVGQQHSTRDNNGKSVTVMLLQTVPANAWQEIAMDMLLGTGHLLGTGQTCGSQDPVSRPRPFPDAVQCDALKRVAGDFRRKHLRG